MNWFQGVDPDPWGLNQLGQSIRDRGKQRVPCVPVPKKRIQTWSWRGTGDSIAPAPLLDNMVMFQHGEFPSIYSGWWKSPVSPRRRCSKNHQAELARNDPVSSGPVLNQHPTCCIRRCQALRAAVKGQKVGWGDNTFQMGYKSELFIASCC